MRIVEPPTKAPVENVLPLVNIVFLLLIFFMIAGSFSQPDLYKVVAPVAEHKAPAERQPLVVVVNAEGQTAIGDKPYDDDALKQFMIKQVEENKDKKLQVQLKADAELESERLIDLMELLGAAGLNSLQLLTVTE